MKQNLYFLIGRYHHTDTTVLYEYEYVSINEYVYTEMPYQKTSLDINNSKDLRFGNLFEIANNKLILNHKYNEHDYDIAVVLGEDKANQKLLVFGNKIGEQIIDKKNNIYHNYTFYQRGDKLLLKKLANETYRIVHNITQLKLKYKMKQLVK